jgi:hypothetical protein
VENILGKGEVFDLMKEGKARWIWTAFEVSGVFDFICATK